MASSMENKTDRLTILIDPRKEEIVRGGLPFSGFDALPSRQAAYS